MSSTLTILTSTNATSKSTKELILDLFQKNPNTIYSNQEAIATAINNELHESRSQSAISKALKKMTNQVIKYDNANYHIIKIDTGYKLYNKQCLLAHIKEEFAEKKVFISYSSYVISKNIVAYTVHTKFHLYIKDEMIKAFDENTFFDIISHDNKIYFLLNPDCKKQDEIRNLPQEVKAIENSNNRKMNYNKTK